MNLRPSTTVDLPALLASDLRPGRGADLPPGGWLFEELAARDAATSVALVAAVRRRHADRVRADPAASGGLAAELRQRDDGTAAALRRTIAHRFARIERLAGS